jgi:hypothetical protein
MPEKQTEITMLPSVNIPQGKEKRGIRIFWLMALHVTQ